MKPDWRKVEVLLICVSIIVSASILALGLRRGNSLMEVRLSTPALSTLRGMPGEAVGRGTITVTGFGEASGRADMAVVTLSVQTEGSSAGDVVRENAMRMSRVIEALRGLGVEKESMETSSYQLHIIYDKEGNPKGYRAVNTLRVKTTNLDEVGKIIDAAVEAGANRVESIRFTISNEEIGNLKREAYLEAVRDAEEKAELIAEKLGIEITGVQSVTVSELPYRPYAYEMRLSAATSTPIIEGTITVSASVQVVYEIG